MLKLNESKGEGKMYKAKPEVCNLKLPLHCGSLAEEKYIYIHFKN